MDIQQLRVFVEIARQGSFAAAARQLDLAPSVATRVMAALERELGVRLLQRSTRKLSLTEAGARYHEQVAGLLDGLERAADEARHASGAARGTVRITASVAYGQTVLVPSLPALHERHPGLEIDLLLTDNVVDLVADRVDLALRLGSRVDASLVGMPLRRVRYHVVASPQYLQRHGRVRQPADLAGHECLRFALPGFRTQWTFRGPGNELETVEVHGWLVASTALALHRASLDGLGPALLPDWLVGPDLARGSLVDLFPQHEATAHDFDSAVWLLYASRTYMPRRVREVMAFLKQAL